MLLGNSNMEIRGNVGEWSELYVLIKLLSDGVLYQSDINLCSDSNNAYQVIKAFKDEANYSLEFDRVDNHLKVYRVINDENTLLKEYTFDDFNLFRNYLLNNTKFEQASTGENESQPGLKDPNTKKKYYFGWLYKENESHYIKLNLQIRFN